MILPPDPREVAKVAEQLRQRGTVREVKARGTDEDEAELREWQRETKRRSRDKNGSGNPPQGDPR